MSRPAPRVLRSVLSLDKDRIEPFASFRCTIGVVVPLVVGLATGAVALGVAAAVGALCAGFCSFQGAYRSRAWLTMAVAVGMGASTVVGSVAARHEVTFVLVAAAWSFAAGMLAALGLPALVMGMQWVVAELIVGAIPMTTSQAVLRGAAVIAGGIFQTLLVVVVWPFGTYDIERRAIRVAYADLAQFAAETAAGVERPRVAGALTEARDTLGDPRPLSHARRLLAFQALVDEAERIRIEIAALARHRTRVPPDCSQVIDGVLTAGSGMLSAVAGALARDAEPRVSPGEWAGFRRGAERARTSVIERGGEPWVADDIGRAAEALGGQVRSAVRLAAVSAGRSDPMIGGTLLPKRHREGLAEAVTTLRANLDWQSAAFRHALRLATTVGVGALIFRLTNLNHGYWIPLTALVVLRPDFASTTQRGIARLAGTIGGAGLATVLVAVLHPDQVGLAVLFALASFAAFILARVNYAAFSVAVTSYVVFLLAFVKLPELSTAGYRLLDTVIGGVLAIIAYLVWPTWESRRIGSSLAAVLEAQAEYLEGVLSVWADPVAARDRLGELRTKARMARSNAEASLDRLLVEPVRASRHGGIGRAEAKAIVAACGSIALAILSLHAQLPPPDGRGHDEVLGLARALTARARAEAEWLKASSEDEGAERHGLRDIPGISRLREMPGLPELAGVGEGAVAAGTDGGPAPTSLRRLHSQLAEALSSQEGSTLTAGPALLVADTDLIVDSLNVISETLAEA